jgi:hypothetical protein
MACSETIVDIRDWAELLYDLSDEMDLCLYRHASQKLNEMSEYFWRELQHLFDIPTETSLKRVRHTKGEFIGRQEVIDNPKCYNTVWKDETGQVLYSGRSPKPERSPLYKETKIHSLLSDLDHLDHLILIIRGFCGSLIAPLTGQGPTPDTITKLRTIARRLDGRRIADHDGGPVLTGEAKVLALLVQNPTWSDTKLAEEAGVNRTSLYKMTKFVQAKAAMKGQGRDNIRRRQNERRGTPDDADS